ncbi:MAG: UDP-N-acetylmuramoyl-L-alanine--D-glutamate ligase [Melioribacteraceae bacterium]|nr:UDP-N-acetylmuramoyl-L-alanine--D-glutamate ligase [Melioribacteraceae bacterium]
MEIKGKNITIIGAERSGIAAALLAKKMGAVPFVSDFSVSDKISERCKLLEKEEIKFELGSHSDQILNCDFAVLSPGVPSDSNVVLKLMKADKKIISEIEFAYNFCKGKIIAITGTNGKTTTTSLAAYTLKSCGVKSYAAGNIGLAFSDIALEVDELDFVVLEVSSFQLDFIEKFKPNFAVLLNITPDHLDRYDNKLENYVLSKFRIFENQNEADYAIINYDDPIIAQQDLNCRAAKYSFSTNSEVERGTFLRGQNLCFKNEDGEEVVCGKNDVILRGKHNLSNVLSVLNVFKLINLPNEAIKNALSTFEPVEHRLEFVAEIEGVDYINDSKATNVDAVWYALESFDEAVYLILGGKDKGNDYTKIDNQVQRIVKKIYAIGSSSDKIKKHFESFVNVRKVRSLKEAIKLARKEAHPGEVVLLSPACASFDMFENYEDRGRKFKEAVNEMVV